MIVVTGATGTLGGALLPRLTDAGARVRALSRRPHPAGERIEWRQADLATGDGLEPAVEGARTIVHCASEPRGPRGPRADVDAARRLIEAAARQRADTRLIYISIVGVDQHPYPYYQAKHEVESLIEDSGLPHVILRATQFHDLVAFFLGTLARAPVMPVPAATRCQPIAVEDVADRLAELALGGETGTSGGTGAGAETGRVPDMGGPQILDATELARTFLRATGRRRPVLPVPLPGAVAAAFRRGLHLAPGHAVGTVTWADFLAARYRGKS